jgi:hypothetical protein
MHHRSIVGMSVASTPQFSPKGICRGSLSSSSKFVLDRVSDPDG